VSPAAERANHFTSRLTGWLGSIPAIAVAIGVILVWAATGPLLGFSDTWQLIINTFTTLVTFTMVFIIQNTQNRDGRAIQTKLDAQSEALVALCRERGLHNLVDRLLELTGVEEQPEKVIEEEQRKVRRAG
jgi:low affinity Fe/Cu permease